MRLLAEQTWTYSHEEAASVVGIEGQVDRLITQLQASPKAVVVHGMGGIGKTTLAKQIFCHRRSKEFFDGGAWAYVSKQFHLPTICKDILYQLYPDAGARDMTNRLSDSELPGMLFSILRENNYLVVLDDVWKNDDWRCLAPAFPVQDSCKSKMLITSRDPQILSHLGDQVVSTWQAETLGDSSCWELLQKKGDFNLDSLPDPSMKLLAQKMLKRCGGNPLAIVALRGVLATKKSLQGWESVLENLQSRLQDGPHGKVYDIIARGYYDLPYDMKPCFLYMGHFPEDFQIDVERIYNLWIAEGIVLSTQVQNDSNMSLEDRADDYLNQLVQKGMIQVVDIGKYERISTCRLHDLMRDKCLEMTREEDFVQIMDLEYQNTSVLQTDRSESNHNAGSNEVRRLTMHVGEVAGESVLQASSGSVSSLRSLLFVSANGSNEVSAEWIKGLCKRFKLLRILDFEGVTLTGPLPSEVGNLVFLTYLSLRGTQISELPSSVKNLRSLLILDLRVKKVSIKLPNVLWKITSLRHLYLPATEMSQESHAYHRQGYKIENDNSFLNLENLSRLEIIANVDLDRVEEDSLLELSSIRKLSATCKHKMGCLVSVLESASIKKLRLKVHAGLLVRASSMRLSDSRSLHTLHIDAEKGPWATFLPIQVEMFPRNLVSLGFWYCKLEVDPMPILEQLQNLKSLQFRICYNGRKMKCSGIGFPRVTFLALDGLWFLKRWSVDNGGFCNLKQLDIYNCLSLKKLPDALPPNISVYCMPEFQEKVNEFRCRAQI